MIIAGGGFAMMALRLAILRTPRTYLYANLHQAELREEYRRILDGAQMYWDTRHGWNGESVRL